MEQAFEYPPAVQVSQCEEVLRLIITRGSLTHGECEEATKNFRTGRITVIRSVVSDLRTDYLWSIPGRPDWLLNARNARYTVDWERLETLYSISANRLKEHALNAISSGMVLNHLYKFIDYSKTHEPKPKNPAADPLARLIFKASKKVRRDEAQGDLWAY